MRVGIVGRRSWIATHLRRELLGRGHDVGDIEKSDIHHRPSSLGLFDCIYLIAGRARPTPEDARAELGLLQACSRLRHVRMVYLSSAAVDRWEKDSRSLSPAGERYVLGKRACEAAFLQGSRSAYVLRAPVIFGPGQDIRSDMLVPSVARAVVDDDGLDLAQPLEPFEMTYVGDTVRAMADLGENLDPKPVTSLRSSRSVTPLDVVSVMAPGLRLHFRPGWRMGRPEPSTALWRDADNRPIDRMTAPFRDTDLIDTMAWYRQTPDLLGGGKFLELTEGG